MHCANRIFCWVRGTPQIQSLWRTPHPASYLANAYMPSPARGEGAVMISHRSFSVDRPASASTTEMIQKRITTCGSVQPFCSK
jgi:hypothetical protein